MQQDKNVPAAVGVADVHAVVEVRARCSLNEFQAYVVPKAAEQKSQKRSEKLEVIAYHHRRSTVAVGYYALDAKSSE